MFKKGSVFCYLKGLYNLTNKAKENTKYSKVLLNRIIRLEADIYSFYGKKVPENRGIIKWLEK